MSGFHDLVLAAQPRLCNMMAKATAGASWEWQISGINDATGAAVDLSSVTGTCQVVTAPEGTMVLALTFTGGLGSFTVSADESATAGLVSGSTSRRCSWFLTLSDGTDVVFVWGPQDSPFEICPGVA